MIEIFKPGSEVEIIHLRKIGFITGVYIKENNISYDVSFWNNSTRTSVNLEAFEIKPKDEEKMKMGYVNNGDINKGEKE